MKIYLACSFAYKNDKIKAERIKIIDAAAEILRSHGCDVYVPHEHKIKDGESMSNYEWSHRVFQEDVKAIDESDKVVLLTFGKENNNAGVSWEAGYVHGLFVAGVKTESAIVIKMNESIESMMMWFGSKSQLRGIESLRDFDNLIWSNTLKDVELS